MWSFFMISKLKVGKIAREKRSDLILKIDCLITYLLISDINLEKYQTSQLLISNGSEIYESYELKHNEANT